MTDNEICISEVSHGLVAAVGRTDKKVVTKAGDFVISQAAGEWGKGTDTGGRFAPTQVEISKLTHSRTNRAAGRMATISKIGWLPNSNSSATTRNREHQRIQPMKS